MGGDERSRETSHLPDATEGTEAKGGPVETGNQERELLRENVKEFVRKELEPVALRIEREGISKELLSKLAVQGFLGARVPSERGGAGLDEIEYLVILEELAKASPSVAAKVLITNSLFASLVLRSGKFQRVLGETASGSKRATVGFSRLLVGYRQDSSLKMAGSHVSGVEEHVLDSNVDSILILSREPRDRLLYLENGVKPLKDYSRLGLRGLRFSPVEFDSEFEDLPGDGLTMMEEAFRGMSLPVAAISLGIASGALTKTIEYTTARRTFGQPLKNYQPVAFRLSSLRSNEEMLRNFIYRESLSETEGMMAREKSAELAMAVAKEALQLHGGYGYFDDFGLDKYYRDSMAFFVFFSNSVKRVEELSTSVFGSRSGFL